MKLFLPGSMFDIDDEMSGTMRVDQEKCRKQMIVNEREKMNEMNEMKEEEKKSIK